MISDQNAPVIAPPITPERMLSIIMKVFLLSQNDMIVYRLIRKRVRKKSTVPNAARLASVPAIQAMR